MVREAWWVSEASWVSEARWWFSEAWWWSVRRGGSVRHSGSLGRGDRGNADQLKRAAGADREQRLLSGKQAVRTENKDCCRESRLSRCPDYAGKDR